MKLDPGVMRRRDSGFTLIEVSFVAALVGALTLMIVQSLADLARTQAYAEGQAHIAQIADRTMRVVARDVSFSVRTFTAGTEADGYLAVLDVDDATHLTQSRLPALTEVGYFQEDGEKEVNTGNVVLLARNERPEVIDVGVSESRLHRIDTVRFVHYGVCDLGTRLSLSRWGSAVLARKKDILSIADPIERRLALVGLFNAGVRFAWQLSEPVEGSLSVITELGELVALPAEMKFPADVSQSHATLIDDESVGVAPNGRAGKVTVPGYAVANDPFPAGFEVRIDGPSTGKLAMVRLVLRAGKADSRENFAEVVRMISCRDG